MANKYQFEIEGISDLKMDAWQDGVQPKNDEGYIKQAEGKVYKDDKGNISIPASALKAAMKLASSEVGKKMEAKKNRQTIQSAVFIDQSMLSLGKKKHDGIVRDIVTRKGQGDKVTRVPTYRPLIKNGWKVTGTITAFQNAPKEFIQASIELAGMRYGLLSHRPEFGRFQLNKLVEVK
jgi:hypothetical protein